MTRLVVSFPPPTEPLSQNAALRMRPYLVRRRMAPWRVRTRLALEESYLRFHLLERREAPVPVVVQLTLPFATERGRDPHNYTGTVVKAAVDGIRDAGYVPDDTPEWVTVLDSALEVQRGSLLAHVSITDLSDHTSDTLATLPRQG